MKREKHKRFKKHKELVRRAIGEARKRHTRKLAYWNEKMRQAAERRKEQK